jgi:hypothetical protein
MGRRHDARPGVDGIGIPLDLAGGSFRLMSHRQRRAHDHRTHRYRHVLRRLRCQPAKGLAGPAAVRTATVDFASRKAVIESELSKAELIALIEGERLSGRVNYHLIGIKQTNILYFFLLVRVIT